MSQDWNEYADRMQKQLPAAPAPLVDGYVNWSPWVYLILGALGVVFGILLLVLSAVVAPMMVLFGYASAGLQLIISVVALVVGGALGVAGGRGMMQRSLTGWWLIAAALIVDALQALLTVHILNLIVLLAIAYVHLSVKPRYT